MATVHANKILTKFMLLLGGHNHCVKVSSDSEMVRGMGLWEFSGALRELMLKCQTVWTQIGTDRMSGLIWVQTVYKAYQQTKCFKVLMQ